MTHATVVPESSSIDRPEAVDMQRVVERLDDDLTRMAGRRLLITGGAGFLGYTLVRSVLHYNTLHIDRPIALTVIDNFSRGEPEWLRAVDSPHLRVVRHDVTRPLPTGLDPDFVLHAASIASPSYYRTYPIETMDANVRGLRHLLDHCMERQRAGRPVESVLYFSSSEIYGDPEPEHIPTPETYPGRVSCTGPRACYDESKRYGETLCVNYHQQHGLPIRIVRPFNNYGPGLDIRDRRLLADFARCVIADRDIVMYSDGSPTRTFCYVADAVVGYYRALVRGRAGEAYNIGADAPEIAVRDVAEKVVGIARDLFGYSGRAIYQTHDEADYLTDNPQRRCPAIDKARAELDFEPEISLDEGLRRSLLWYRRQADEAEEA